MAEQSETPPTARRTVRVGVVSSTKGDKTIRVIVRTQVRHPMYGKIMRQSTKVAVHDPTNAAGLGDVVEITPCRRISKTKSWRLMRVIRKGTPGLELPTEQGSAT
jgi:small subunit ribosomal protein S17